MYRLLLPTGMVALLVGAMVFAAQVRDPQKAPPTENLQKGAIAGEKALADKQAQSHRKRPRVYLGVFTVPVEDINNRARKKLKLSSNDGVYVAEVLPDSPAEEAGLKHGDVITHVNGKLIEDEDELVKDLNEVGPGKQIDLTVFRDGKKQSMKAELDEIPAGEAGSLFNQGDGNEEVMGMCHENAQRIEQLERKISRLEKRLSEMEKSRSSSAGR
jgi:membrane-associated protease RseP (regulator of RpoE activity)